MNTQTRMHAPCLCRSFAPSNNGEGKLLKIILSHFTKLGKHINWTPSSDLEGKDIYLCGALPSRHKAIHGWKAIVSAGKWISPFTAGLHCWPKARRENNSFSRSCGKWNVIQVQHNQHLFYNPIKGISLGKDHQNPLGHQLFTKLFSTDLLNWSLLILEPKELNQHKSCSLHCPCLSSSTVLTYCQITVSWVCQSMLSAAAG